MTDPDRIARLRQITRARLARAALSTSDLTAAASGFGMPEGRPLDRGEQRRVRVAVGNEAPRVSERIPGVVGDMAEDVENAARGVPVGIVENAAGIARDALPAAAAILNPVQGLSDLVTGKTKRIRDAVGEVGAKATEAVADVTQPEGTAGTVGRVAGGFLDPVLAGAAVTRLSKLRALKGLPAGPSLTDEAGKLGAFHGSPHKFDKFSMDKIGTGEGAQAYGHGLYFAGKKEVAQHYRNKLSAGQPPSWMKDGVEMGPSEAVADYFTPGRIVPGYSGHDRVIAFHPSTDTQGWWVEVEQIVKQADGTIARAPGERVRGHSTMPSDKELAAVLEPQGYTSKRGALYDVDLDVDDADLLDWDKPLSEQSPKVQEAVRALVVGTDFDDFDDLALAAVVGRHPRDRSRAYSPTGQELYNDLTGPFRDQAGASRALREAGIPGIRYLDGSSRTTPAHVASMKRALADARETGDRSLVESIEQQIADAEAASAHNYVMFDDNRVSITGREGKLGSDGVGGTQMLTTIAGAGGGAATGAAADDEHPVRGAIVGGLVGGAVGVGAGKVATKLGQRGGVAVEPETAGLTDDALDAIMKPKAAGDIPPPRTPPPSAPASAGGIPPFPARPDVDEFVNVAKFSLADASGDTRLRQEMSRVIERDNLAPKVPVTWDETRAMAAGMGLDAEDLSREAIGRLSGPKMLAIRNIISANVDEIETTAKQLADANLPRADRARAEQRMNALDTQNMALLTQFTKARSQTGRDLNNLKIVAMRTRDPLAWKAKAAQWAGPDALTGDIQRQIEQMAASNDVAGYLQLVSGLKKSSIGQKLSTFWKANLLTNPLTHVVNSTSNATLAGMEVASQAPGAVFDRLMGLATKRRTMSAPGTAQLRASLTGARQGLREAKLVMKGVPLDEATQKFDFSREVNYGNGTVGRILNAYTRGVFRTLAAADRPFRMAALRGSLANQAKAAGIKLEDATEDMALQAIADAEQAVVQDATAAGEFLKGFSRIPAVGPYIAPFTRTPGAVATRIGEYSPIGGAIGSVKMAALVRRAMKGVPTTAAEQREIAKLLGRATTGTGIMALGMYLAAKGRITGITEAEDRSERDTNYLLGRPDMAIKIGDTHYALGRIPLGNLLGVGANLYGIMRQPDQSPGGVAAGLGATVVRSVTDQPFLTGIEGAINAAQNPTERAGRLVENVATGFIPASAAMGAAARGTDPLMREARGVKEAVQSRIPGASRSLPAIQDQFGRDVEREGGLVDAMANPFRRTKDRTANDPSMQELARLGVTISKRRPGGTRDRAQTRALTADEGPWIEGTIRQFIQSEQYRQMDDPARVEEIERIIRRERGRASRRQTSSRLERLRALRSPS